jgi:hypothetical protein
MKQQYTEINFRSGTLAFIAVLNSIIKEYQELGFVLTVRQLYYQCVARGIIPNTQKEYTRMATITNDAKMAGLLDWDAIEDRTRAFIRRNRWESGQQIIKSAEANYHQDLWENQPVRVFVIVEKEALVGVLEGVCRTYDVPLLAARGYPSGSVLREFATTDLSGAITCGQAIQILQLGDHDPSGIDMTRDLCDRLSVFTGEHVELDRIALNMEQIEELHPPENPAKATDTRFDSYRRKFGDKSWELDALNPTYLENLVETNISHLINFDNWEKTQDEIAEVKKKINNFAKQWK